MRRAFLLLILLIFVFSISLRASEVSYGVIEGVVKDMKGEPLEGLRVYIKGTDLITKTDSSGRYRIENVPVFGAESSYSLLITKVGYRQLEKVVIVKANQTIIVDIEFPLGSVWQKVYGGSLWDEAYSIQQTTDGGYIVAGHTESFGAGGYDVYILKLDKNGNRVWQKTYGGKYNDGAYSIQQTTDGGYIVAGYTTSFGAGGYDVYILKLDKDGNKVWEKTYGGEDEDVAWSIQQTTDGGYIVAGKTDSFGSGDFDIYILKLDKDGNRVWGKTYGGEGDDEAYSIQQTTDGGYIVAGETESFGADWSDVYILKLDKDGNKIWEKTYGEEYDEKAYSIQQTTDGGYIVAGWTESFGAGRYDVYILKLDKNGNKVWEKTYGGSRRDEARFIQQTTDGGYIVAGYTESFGAGKYDAYILKLDKNGNRVWEKTYGGEDYDEALSIQQTTDGGYIVAGYTESFGAGKYDAYILKLDKDGNTVPLTED